jgi:hypothetical protein
MTAVGVLRTWVNVEVNAIAVPSRLSWYRRANHECARLERAESDSIDEMLLDTNAVRDRVHNYFVSPKALRRCYENWQWGLPTSSTNSPSYALLNYADPEG